MEAQGGAENYDARLRALCQSTHTSSTKTPDGPSGFGQGSSQRSKSAPSRHSSFPRTFRVAPEGRSADDFLWSRLGTWLNGERHYNIWRGIEEGVDWGLTECMRCNRWCFTGETHHEVDSNNVETATCIPCCAGSKQCRHIIVSQTWLLQGLPLHDRRLTDSQDDVRGIGRILSSYSPARLRSVYDSWVQDPQQFARSLPTGHRGYDTDEVPTDGNGTADGRSNDDDQGGEGPSLDSTGASQSEERGNGQQSDGGDSALQSEERGPPSMPPTDPSKENTPAPETPIAIHSSSQGSANAKDSSPAAKHPGTTPKSSSPAPTSNKIGPSQRPPSKDASCPGASTTKEDTPTTAGRGSSEFAAKGAGPSTRRHSTGASAPSGGTRAAVSSTTAEGNDEERHTREVASVVNAEEKPEAKDTSLANFPATREEIRRVKEDVLRLAMRSTPLTLFRTKTRATSFDRRRRHCLRGTFDVPRLEGRPLFRVGPRCRLADHANLCSPCRCCGPVVFSLERNLAHIADVVRKVRGGGGWFVVLRRCHCW